MFTKRKLLNYDKAIQYNVDSVLKNADPDTVDQALLPTLA